MPGTQLGTQQEARVLFIEAQIGFQNTNLLGRRPAPLTVGLKGQRDSFLKTFL